jgi:erythromycin esterase
MRARSRLSVTLAAAGLLAACGGSSSPTAPAPADATQAATWLQSAVVPFDTDDPAAPLGDLQPLRAMVGGARVVALGEATHGTAEFFRMKHRVLRLLVEEEGFTAFFIEASFADTEPINDYVLFGRGDARRALAGQGFWTWTTEEVLAMVEWMRGYNRLHGPVLSFRGFDMQHPLPSMDAVVEYLQQVDAPAAERVRALYAPFRPYADWLSTGTYRTATADVRAAVHASVAEASALLAAGQARYEAASSAAAFATAMLHARVVVQAEALFAPGGDAARDPAMAENALALLAQAGPGARAVLWAHNLHVQRSSETLEPMGRFLDRQLSSQMVVVGFAFGQGTCTAVGSAPGGAGGLATHTVPPPVAGSFEDVFSRAARPRFLLDTRRVAAGSPGPDWFLLPHPHRNIGSAYNAANPGQYFTAVRMQRLYDVVAYFEDTTASRLYPP